MFGFNILGNIKALGAMAMGAMAIFGWFKYNNKVEEVEELKSYSDQKDKEAQAMKQEVKVQEVVHSQEIDNLKMTSKVKDSSKVAEKKKSKKINQVNATVENAIDGEEFDLKA